MIAIIMVVSIVLYLTNRGEYTVLRKIYKNVYTRPQK